MASQKMIIEVIDNLLKSLNTKQEGWSGRKISAAVGVTTSVYITIKLLPADKQFDALCVWLLFALLCLGIVTIEQVIKLKNGNENKPIEPTPITEDKREPFTNA